jgi:hypothetical protein
MPTCEQSSLTLPYHAAQSIKHTADFMPANSVSAIRQISDTLRGPSFTADTMGNVFQRPSQVEDDRIPSADDDSISCWSPNLLSA